jgi:hypothetical protein
MGSSLRIICDNAIHTPALESNYFLGLVHSPGMYAAMETMGTLHLFLADIGSMRMQGLVITKHKTERTRPQTKHPWHGKQATWNLRQHLLSDI